ncbi:MAG: pyruvate kinase [Acidobacteria bacterium]|nr:pyruvate kinase [Acidobacteriota bacterium]
MRVEKPEERMRKTKLVITIGPSLEDPDLLREVLREADAVRLNASHGDAPSRTRAVEQVRTLSADLGRLVPIFLDLQGPKWRVGDLPRPIELPAESIGCLLAPGDPCLQGAAWDIPLPHPEILAGARPGQRWLLDDGSLELQVTSAGPGGVRARVVRGGLLKARKGIHPLGLEMAVEPLTDKDREDVAWGVRYGVEFFAQSFVRSAADIRELQRLIAAAGGTQPIIAKIEHPQALERLEEILEASWGVMVARGDLGVELGVERVPATQKHIIRCARKALKPVITATQMLESMIENPSPTRAEASDVANAIWDGTDAVMLSAESAAGQYPGEAVAWLARIAAEADQHPQAVRGDEPDLVQHHTGRTDVSVAFAASRCAEQLEARWIVAFTEGGGSARMVSRLAGPTRVIGATTDLGTARRMGLLRGVEPLLIRRFESTDEMVESVERLLQERHNLDRGDTVVMTFGLPLWRTGTTNSLKVVVF